MPSIPRVLSPVTVMAPDSPSVNVKKRLQKTCQIDFAKAGAKAARPVAMSVKICEMLKDIASYNLFIRRLQFVIDIYVF